MKSICYKETKEEVNKIFAGINEHAKKHTGRKLFEPINEVAKDAEGINKIED
jgi:protein-arginine kinase activator protein McsA